MNMTKSNDFKELYNAILSLENEEECRLFFEDICTMKELETMTQRLQVAKMLLDGKTFNEIVQATSLPYSPLVCITGQIAVILR